MNKDSAFVETTHITLTDNIDLDWLRAVEPRFFDDYIKFVVNTKTNQVHVGMDVHSDCLAFGDDEEDFYGGNIFFDDGHIEYESTLNIAKNERVGTESDDLRIITNPDLIEKVNAVLLSWVILDA